MEEQVSLNCPTCGWKPYSGALIYCEIIGKAPYYCPDCGKIYWILGKEIRREGDMEEKECRICGQILNKDWNYCIECGVRIEDLDNMGEQEIKRLKSFYRWYTKEKRGYI